MGLTSKFPKWNEPIILLRIAYAFITLMICIWVVFFPRPYYWAIGIAITYIPALVAGSVIDRTRFSLEDPSRSDGKTVNLFAPLFFVSGALSLRTIFDFQITSEWDLLIITAPTGLVLALLVWSIINKANFLVVLVFSIMYTWPVAIQLNDISPPSNEVIFSGSISRKYSSTKPVTYTVVVKSGKEEKHISVSRAAYSRYSLGGRACAKEVTGWLGITTRFPIPCEHL
ncbi:hypothetical protein J2W71_003494 [Pseudomonas sp. 3400]|nr:hypothetical protein [Pseudomonas sp. 3400]MDR7013554.1 hypothetical protein [Pseudomonas alcaliphila]